MVLNWWHRAILRFVEGPGYMAAREVGIEVWRCQSPRTASQTALQSLRKLEQAGYVERLPDDKYPLAWRRTDAGTIALIAGNA